MTSTLPKCGAPTLSTGQPCQRICQNGESRCHIHPLFDPSRSGYAGIQNIIGQYGASDSFLKACQTDELKDVKQLQDLFKLDMKYLTEDMSLGAGRAPLGNHSLRHALIGGKLDTVEWLWNDLQARAECSDLLVSLAIHCGRTNSIDSKNPIAKAADWVAGKFSGASLSTKIDDYDLEFMFQGAMKTGNLDFLVWLNSYMPAQRMTGELIHDVWYTRRHHPHVMTWINNVYLRNR